MKKLAFVIIPLALVLVLAACGKNPQTSTSTSTSTGTSTSTTSSCPSQTTVDMAATNFVQHCVTISKGATLTWNDPSSTGGYHILCVGINQTCASTAPAGAPSDLDGPNGFTIQQGQTHTDTFSTAGTYQITCKVHPSMNVMVKVQ